MRKLAALFVTAFLLFAPSVSLAAFSVKDSGLKDTVETGYGPITDENYNIAKFIGNFIIKPAVGLLGLIFFCLMIYAGFLWMTAAGDDKKISRAREILQAAVIGTVIVLAAYAITGFVFNSLSGV